MDLLIVGHMVLGENALNFFKVPVWDAGHLLNLLRRAPIVDVPARGPIDAETVPVVIALTIAHELLLMMLVIHLTLPYVVLRCLTLFFS